MENSSCLAKIKAKIEDEYEFPRTGATQYKWMKEVGIEIKGCTCSHKEFRLRAPPFKRFIEEALPISYFVQQHQTFKTTTVTLRKGSQRYDAELSLGKTTEYIEVVNAEDGHLFNMKAQLLNKFGVAPGTFSGRVPYLKNLLKSNTVPNWFGDIISGNLEFQSCRDSLLKQIERKVNKNYGPGYHLLACFELDMQFNELSEISTYLKSSSLNLKAFESVHLFERRSALISRVFP